MNAWYLCWIPLARIAYSFKFMRHISFNNPEPNETQADFGLEEGCRKTTNGAK